MRKTVKHEDKLQKIWSELPSGDREVLLGHGREELSLEDRARLAQILTALGRRKRQGSLAGSKLSRKP